MQPHFLWPHLLNSFFLQLQERSTPRGRDPTIAIVTTSAAVSQQLNLFLPPPPNVPRAFYRTWWSCKADKRWWGGRINGRARSEVSGCWLISLLQKEKRNPLALLQTLKKGETDSVEIRFNSKLSENQVWYFDQTWSTLCVQMWCCLKFNKEERVINILTRNDK